ncbi:MAG: hypothetical protein S4CHLAM7_08930 [Chlamydiae bacterium]|nr:hypothetical protein [Chlamydiota bacterium]
MFALTAKKSDITAKILTVSACVLFMFVCANFKIYVSFSPVAITMHTFAVFVLGALLPFRLSLTCFLAYFVHSLVGAPFIGAPIVFLAVGYLLGMIVALYLLDKAKNKMPLVLTLLLAEVCILGLGVLHMQFFLGLKKALVVGVVPYIVGDVLKIFAAYVFIKAAGKLKDQSNTTTV